MVQQSMSSVDPFSSSSMLLSTFSVEIYNWIWYSFTRRICLDWVTPPHTPNALEETEKDRGIQSNRKRKRERERETHIKIIK
jgi:hypothetical protein